MSDEMRHWKETDCQEERTRTLRMAMREAAGALATPAWATGDDEWTEIDPAEQRLLCGQAPVDADLPNLEALRGAARQARRQELDPPPTVDQP